MLQVIAGAERDAFTGPIVGLLIRVIAGRAMLVRVREVVGGELVQVHGTIAKHGHGEVLQEVRQTRRNVEIHRSRRSHGDCSY